MSRNSKRPDPYIVEIQAHDGTSVVTLRLSTHSISTTPTDNPPNTYYPGTVTDIGGIEMIIWEDGGTSGQAHVDVGFIDIANVDGRYDAWINYGWGRGINVKSLPSADSSVAGAELILRAIVSGIESPDALRSLRLRLRSRMAELDVPLLSQRYLGTTISIDSTDLAEGDVDLTDQLKPAVFGTCFNVPGILVNKVYVFYQFANNPLSSITPFDGGIGDGFTYVGDFPDLSALRDATVGPGAYATCLTSGIVRFGYPPAFEVTADVVEGATLADRSAARVMERMLALIDTIDPLVDLDTTSFDAFHTAHPAEVGIYVSSDDTAVTLLSRVSDSVGGAIVATVQGTFKIIDNDGPSSTPDTTLTLRELIGGSEMTLFAAPPGGVQGVPAWQVVINWGRVWRTQSSGQLAPRIAEATTGADLARKQLVANEMRQSMVEDVSVIDQHPFAVTVTIDTLLAQQADAEAMAADRLALYKVRRDHIDFPVSINGPDPGNIPLGNTVRIQMDGRGRYNSGVNMMVLGRVDDYTARRRTLHLWG